MATVGQLMTRSLTTIGEDECMQAAAQQMHGKRIGSLLVKRADEFVGIVTETDVVKAVADDVKEPGQVPVKAMMSVPVITVDRKMSPHYARDLMADRNFRHLGVTEDGVIVGIISVRDLLAYFKTVSHEGESAEP